MYVSAYRALTDEEISSELEIESRKAYTNAIRACRGPEASMDDLSQEIGEDIKTPHFEPYEDKKTPAYSVPDRDGQHS